MPIVKKITFSGLNLVPVLFFIFSLATVLNVSTVLHLLSAAKLLYVSLCVIVLLVGSIFDNVNLLSLTFPFLILSAAEFGLGPVIILTHRLLFRSIYLNTTGKDMRKFALRFKKKILQKLLLLQSYTLRMIK